ncbi:hypothetical protein BU16DRAFT_561589 [Lophium mytilinum]|uniref:Uncharacterized protein n=1 Tax=Lophium mytilinum TaxID=390894 RepID=A0A6A6QT52_9PEZI|nr:hypothetical protein BU16DRAFT_561589 [Lophium mytilinum]
MRQGVNQAKLDMEDIKHDPLRERIDPRSNQINRDHVAKRLSKQLKSFRGLMLSHIKTLGPAKKYKGPRSDEEDEEKVTRSLLIQFEHFGVDISNHLDALDDAAGNMKGLDLLRESLESFESDRGSLIEYLGADPGARKAPSLNVTVNRLEECNQAVTAMLAFEHLRSAARPVTSEELIEFLCPWVGNRAAQQNSFLRSFRRSNEHRVQYSKENNAYSYLPNPEDGLPQVHAPGGSTAP